MPKGLDALPELGWGPAFRASRQYIIGLDARKNGGAVGTDAPALLLANQSTCWLWGQPIPQHT